MLAVFGTAKPLAELFERFKQPGIVGEILAGVLIGPGVLRWAAPNEILNTLADLGVMFLLFRVGLEVRPRDLIQVGRTALLVASLGVIVPFVLGWSVMRIWGEPHTESIFVAAALVAISVGITAQILSARGLLEHRASRVIMAAAVIDDVLGFMVLAVVSAVARRQVRIFEIIVTALVAAGFGAITIKWGSRTITPVFLRVERRLRVGEVQFNLAMVTLFSHRAHSHLRGRRGTYWRIPGWHDTFGITGDPGTHSFAGRFRAAHSVLSCRYWAAPRSHCLDQLPYPGAYCCYHADSDCFEARRLWAWSIADGPGRCSAPRGRHGTPGRGRYGRRTNRVANAGNFSRNLRGARLSRRRQDLDRPGNAQPLVSWGPW
jgi:hypothetical protein